MRCSVVKGNSLAITQASTVPSKFFAYRTKVKNKPERQFRTKPVSGSRHCRAEFRCVCITDGERDRERRRVHNLKLLYNDRIYNGVLEKEMETTVL